MCLTCTHKSTSIAYACNYTHHQAFADALLIIPKTLAENSGFDVQDTIIKLSEEHASSGLPVGLDVNSGDSLSPEMAGIWLVVVLLGVTVFGLQHTLMCSSQPPADLRIGITIESKGKVFT